MTLSGAGGEAPALAGGGQAPQGAGAGSGQFTNIQDYVKANQPKTAELAQGITSGIQKEATGIRSQLESKRAEFFDPSKYGGAKEFQTQQIQQAGTTAPSQEQAQRFQQLRTGAFAAPELSQQRASSADLSRRAGELQTATGRKEALQGLVGKQTPTYSQGQRQLDQLLLAGDRPSRLESLRNVRGAAGTLGSEVARFGDEAQAARTEAMRVGDEDLGTARTAQQEQISGLQQRLQESFGEGGDRALSTEDLSRLGLEGGVGELYGVDPGLRQGVVSSQGLDRMKALETLAGRDPSLATGEYTAFDPAALQEQVAAQKAAFDPQQASRQAAIQQQEAFLAGEGGGSALDRARRLGADFTEFERNPNVDYTTQGGAPIGTFRHAAFGAKRADNPRQVDNLLNQIRSYEQSQLGSRQQALANLRNQYNIGQGIGVEAPLEPEV
jgi:hypothetical protein